MTTKKRRGPSAAATAKRAKGKSTRSKAEDTLSQGDSPPEAPAENGLPEVNPFSPPEEATEAENGSPEVNLLSTPLASSPTPNWVDYGLSKCDEELVTRAGYLWQAMCVNTIDTILDVAESIRILHDVHYGDGTQGSFTAALVQYGFTAPNEIDPIHKSIRFQLKALNAQEASVREWWASVPEKKKRNWLSPSAIYRNWKASQERETSGQRSGSRRSGGRMSSQIEQANMELNQQLHEATEQIRRGLSPFSMGDTPEANARHVAEAWRDTPDKISKFLTCLREELRALVTGTGSSEQQSAEQSAEERKQAYAGEEAESD